MTVKEINKNVFYYERNNTAFVVKLCDLALQVQNCSFHQKHREVYQVCPSTGISTDRSFLWCCSLSYTILWKQECSVYQSVYTLGCDLHIVWLKFTDASEEYAVVHLPGQRVSGTASSKQSATCCQLDLPFNPEDAVNTFLWKVGKLPSDYPVSQPKDGTLRNQCFENLKPHMMHIYCIKIYISK